MSEGIQVGGPRSKRGVVGTWFDCDYDENGPVGPTAYWKTTDPELVGKDSYDGDVLEDDSDDYSDAGETEIYVIISEDEEVIDEEIVEDEDGNLTF